jgi:CRP-like cAMP-binding protein
MGNDGKEDLYNYIKEISPSGSTDEIMKIIEELHPKRYGKGTLLVGQGNTAYNCYFVLKGCLRIFFVDDDGKENTSGFIIENEPVTILQSYRFRKPSPYSIECIEDCILLEGDLEKEEELGNKNPALKQIIQRGLEDDLEKNQTEQIRFRSMSPEKRYLEFLADRPGLAARIPQHQLASYLGMNPESLSRIKRRLHDSSAAERHR